MGRGYCLSRQEIREVKSKIGACILNYEGGCQKRGQDCKNCTAPVTNEKELWRAGDCQK